MIISYGSYATTLCRELVEDLGAGGGLAAPLDASHASMLRRADSLGDSLRFVDFQWARDPGLEKPWVQDTYGTRSRLRRSTSRRLEFFRRVGSELPSGPLVSVASAVNDGTRSREYVRELLQVRDADFPDRAVVASFVLDRSGLSDPTVLANLGPLPTGVTEIALSVMDATDYPSDWSYDDWYGWLKLIRAFVEQGQDVILPYSDIRGLVGVGVGARELGTGAQQDFRRLQPAQPRRSRSGANPAVSYASLPLLSVLHGSNASLDTEWDEVESHARCSAAFGTLSGLHRLGSSFDMDWKSTGASDTVVRDNRISQHVRALAAAETSIVSGPRADTVNAQLAAAVSIGARVARDTFKNAGGKAELAVRLRAYEAVRRDMSF